MSNSCIPVLSSVSHIDYLVTTSVFKGLNKTELRFCGTVPKLVTTTTSESVYPDLFGLDRVLDRFATLFNGTVPSTNLKFHVILFSSRSIPFVIFIRLLFPIYIDFYLFLRPEV